jgi:hypothetical protein
MEHPRPTMPATYAAASSEQAPLEPAIAVWAPKFEQVSKARKLAALVLSPPASPSALTAMT